MNRLRNLELKRPEVKVPPVLSDLFYDLRERRLLPLVALLVVAIVAVPFLFSDSGSEDPAPSAVPEAGAAKAPEVAKLTVVRADHGLRVPRRRLGHLSPTDPFRQQFTGPANGGAEVTQTSTAATSASTTSTSTSVPTEASAEPEGGVPSATAPSAPSESSPPATSPDNGEITIFTFAIDLKIVKTTTDENGRKSRSEPETRERVLSGTTLPGKKTQVLTYLGISPKSKKPLFLVSQEVTAVFGEADCVAGSASCQLLELEPSFPLTLLYGPNDVRYKFTVLKVEPVATGHF